MNSVEWYMSQFPESMFLCPVQHQQDYATRTIMGKQIAKNSSVLICTIMRNIDKILPYTLARIEATRELFAKSHVYIYENDSVDGTKDIINSIDPKDGYTRDMDVIKPPKFTDMKSIERRTIMANARNKYLEFAREYCAKNLVDYIIILDADLLGGWSYHGLLNSLGQRNWDIIGSNSIYYVEHEGKWHRLFYDSWAFRPLDHPEALSDSEANLFSFNRGEPMIEVNSCFGGLAIYKPYFLSEEINYTNEDCDHPTLHNELVKRGYKIYLNPSQITVYNKSQYVI